MQAKMSDLANGNICFPWSFTSILISLIMRSFLVTIANEHRQAHKGHVFVCTAPSLYVRGLLWLNSTVSL